MTDHERLCELLERLGCESLPTYSELQRMEADRKAMLTRLRSNGLDGLRVVQVVAIDSIGDWLSAALEDQQVCEEMKGDIQMWLASVNNLSSTDKDCSTKKPC